MSRRIRRGASVVEVVMALFTTTLVGVALLTFCRTGDALWSNTTATQNAKDTLYLAVAKMSPTIRNGLSVDPSSTSTTAVIVMPAVDAVNGGYLTPLGAGDVYRFYLSDTSGNPAHSGTILWRSINGTADSSWSLRSGTRGTMDLGDTSLSFSYSPSASPDTVKVTAKATKSAGDGAAVQTTASTEIVLRNHQAANP